MDIILTYTMPKIKRYRQYAVCRCDCGNVFEAQLDNIRSNHTKSCGCLKVEKSKKHGYSYHPLYKIWEAMKNRCLKNHYYVEINVCKEWINNPKSFIEWGIDQGYKKGLSIDRIDNKGDYSPDNCRFADRFTQMSNTRKNVFIDFKGQVKTISQWARELNLHKGTISYRYKKSIPLDGTSKDK